MELAGKSAVVTGGARGIGYACAKAFLREGARVVVGDIDAERGRAAAMELRRAGDVTFVEADVSHIEDARRLIEATASTYGTVDICLNNAAIVHRADFLELAAEDFDRVLAVNLRGAFLVGQAAARRMVADRHAGVILNLSSVNAVVVLPHSVPYTISKAAVAHLTRVMAVTLAAKGIRVNAIGPGSIDTELLRQDLYTDPAARRMVLSRTPMGRLGEPAEIAELAVFLASERASYITGQCVYADGGRLPLNFTVPVAEGAIE